MTEVFELIKTVAGSFGGSFAITAGIILFVFWVHGKFVTMLSNHKALSDKCDEAKSHSDSLCERLDKRVESLRDEMHEVKGDIQYIKSMMNNLINAFQSKADAMVKANSPLSITEVGKLAAIELKAEEAIAVNWENIKTIMDAEIVNKNPYDIQTYCLERITVSPERFFDSARLDAFKIYAFQHGRTLFECMKVIGILVRDKYFSVLGIPLSSLDDPPQPAK